MKIMNWYDVDEIAVFVCATDVLNESITGVEILKAVNQLKNDKAADYDGVINEYIKSTV